MSETEQAEENTAAADSEHSLTRKELSRLERISEILHKKIAVPCTGCRYCCDNCPQGLDILFLLSAYNDYRDEAAALGDKNLAVWRLFRLKALAKEKQPSACIGCGSCTAHCPQGLISLPICGKCQRYDGVCGRGDKRGKKLKERCAV